MEKRRKAPKARTERIVVQRLKDEVLIYDLERHRAHCLNETAARVWELCDGHRSIAEISAELNANEGAADQEEVVWLALEMLGGRDLIEEKIARQPIGTGRREVLKRIAVTAAVALPVVTSILAPMASQAANCIPSGQACTTSANCCSGVCNANVCA